MIRLSLSAAAHSPALAWCGTDAEGVCVRRRTDPGTCFSDRATLKRENRDYGRNSGVSDGCREGCLKLAFPDQETGTAHLSRHSDGHVSTLHMLDGLPDELVTARYPKTGHRL